MSLLHLRRPESSARAEGQASYGMANLRQERTGLPFIVFISQKGDARHAARVKVSPAPRVKTDEMGSYAVSPFGHKAREKLSPTEESLLKRWVETNEAVLRAYWDGEIEYTEDAIEKIKSI